jgi:hypothetical protein
VLVFLSEICGKIGYRTTQEVFHAVLKDFIPSITITMCSGIHSTDPPNLNPDDAIQLLRQCVSLNLEPQVQQLLDKLENLAEVEDTATVMKAFFLPFAGKLHNMTTEQGQIQLVKETQNRVSSFMTKILDLYASRCVGPKPPPPVDWQHSKSGCGCDQCIQFDLFLDNPLQNDILISAGTDDGVQHLRSWLPHMDQDDWIEIPEYETNDELEIALQLYRAENSWPYAVKRWKKDRDVAQKEFDKVFDDKEMRKSMKERLDLLSKNGNLESV